MEKINLFSSSDKYFIYFVGYKETINSIAKKFKTTPRIIIEENKLNKEVSLNDILLIRKGKTLIKTGIDDTFESITKKYNISKDELIYINKIDYLYPYELLLIEYE